MNKGKKAEFDERVMYKMPVLKESEHDKSNND